MSRVRACLTAIWLGLVLAACSTMTSSNSRPAWIDNPGDGVSASAGMHVYGRAAQEELAILRARTEFAKRYGVTIESALTTSTEVGNGAAHTLGSSATNEQVQQAEVKAVVKEKWLDSERDVLWVWLVPAK